MKSLQKDSKVSEDERDAALEDIQKNTDDYIKKVDEALGKKEEDIMAV